MQAAAAGWDRIGIAGKAALVAAGTFISVGLYSMGAALPRLSNEFAEVPNAALLTQLTGAVVAPVFAFSSPVAGRLVARFGVRRVYIASALLFAVGGAGPALFDTLLPILALRVVLALAVAGGFTAGMAGVARLPEAQRPSVLGLSSFVGGGICMPLFPLVGMLADEGWRPAFLAHLVLLPLALLALMLPHDEATATWVPASIPEAPKAGELLAGVPVSLLLVTAAAGLGMTASSLYSPFFLASIGVIEPARIGQVLGAMSLCSLAGSGSYGMIHRRLGTRALLWAGLATMAAGCLVISFAHHTPQAIAGLGLLGTGLSVFVPSAYACTIETLAPDASAPAAMGVLTFALYGAQMAFPLLTGTLGTSASPAAVFLALAGLLALALPLVFASARLQPFPAVT